MCWSLTQHCHGVKLSHFFLTFFFLIAVDFVIDWNETAMGLHVFPILIPPPTSLSTRSLWVFPVHQVRALVSCIQPGLLICFTLDNIHVSMLFSWNIPHLPSPTESKRLFYTSVSLFLKLSHFGLTFKRWASIFDKQCISCSAVIGFLFSSSLSFLLFSSSCISSSSSLSSFSSRSLSPPPF